jgi:hypothetical protein
MERKLIGEYVRLHATGPYGGSGHKSLPYLLPHVAALKPGSVVDYGCGQSNLALLLGERAGVTDITLYDPGIPARAERPSGVKDLLINVDVLEHVPDDELDAVMADMASMAREAIIVIDTKPARLTLSDGRNAHVSLHNGEAWLKRLRPHFPIIRPIVIRRPGRVGFKTFDASLGALAESWIRNRELLRRHGARLVNLALGRRS